MEDNKKINETLGLLNIEENLKVLNEKLKESQERVRQYTSTFGLLRRETERFADVLPKLNWTKNFFEKMLPTEDIGNIGRSLSELEKYELKRQAIIEKRDKVLNKKESSDVDKKLAYVTEEEEVQALNIATLKKTEIWTKLFTSIDKLSKKSIGSQIADIDSLIKYVKTNGANGTIPAGFSEKDIVLINEMAEGYAAGTDAAKAFVKETEATSAGYKKSLSEIIAKNSILKTIDGFNKLGQAAAGSKEEIEAIEKILDGFKGVGTAFTEAGKAMEAMGIEAGEAVVNVGNLITKTVSMAGTGASVGGVWGGVVGAVVGLVSGMAPLLATTKELSKEIKSYYETLIKLSGELIEKQISLIQSSTGENTVKAVETAKELAQYEEETEREYLRKHLKKGSGKTINDKVLNYLGHNDLEGYNSAVQVYYDSNRKIHYKEAFADKINSREVALNKTKFFDPEALFEAGIDVGGLITDSSSVLTSLNAKQINVLKTKAPEIWAKFDEDTRTRLEGIVAAEEIVNKIEAAEKESNTGTTFDKLLADLNKLAGQADLTFDKISESFEGHMSTAILNMVKKKHLTDKLNDWYAVFSEKMNDDKLTPGEIEELKKEYKTIVENANEEYKKAMAFAGLNIPGVTDDTTETRSATAQGIASMSQDTASELNGNFYALFMTVDNIYKILEEKQEQEINKEYTLPTLQEMLSVSKSSNTYLLDIRSNTSHLIAIDSNIEYMNNNILALRNEGVKIRS